MEKLQQTKLISLVRALSRQELKSLKSFIVSGVGGPPGKSEMLLNFLMGFYPGFDQPGLTREQAFAAVFPGNRYDDSKLRYAMTDLYRQASAFTAVRGLMGDRLLYNSVLQQEMARREADKPYESLYYSDAGEGNIDAPRDAEWYYHQFRDAFTYMNLYHPRQKRTGQNPAGLVARYLDQFYLARKLQLLCEMVNSKNVMAADYDYFLQNEIMDALRKDAFKDVPLISIYFRILLTLTEPENEEHFTALRSLLLHETAGIHRGELFDMYQYLMNYCIRKINTGNTGYVQTLFEIYQTVLERKIIYREGKLSQWDFKNIVVIGIRAGQFDFVHRFIEEGKEDLPEAERENAYVYNLAYYYFGTGNFRKAISLLQQVEFTDLYYQLDTRAILLKCYYELDDEETLRYHLAAFRIFLSRNKLVSEYQRTIYRNLVRFTGKLVQCGHLEKKRAELLVKVNEVKQVADINWLRKKIESAA